MKLRRFDYRIKDNKLKPIIISSIVVLILLTGITVYVTQARYKVTNTYNLLSGKVKKFFNSDIALEIKVIDKSGNIVTSEEFPPKKEYSYDSEKSSCENGSDITFSRSEWKATISTDKKDKCTLYFNKGVELATLIKEQAKENNYIYSTTPNFGVVTADGEYGLYSAADDYGTSYYFRGDVESNYVQFGSYKAGSTVNGTTYTKETPMYWRIIRINGDSTIRMIYDGTEPIANGTTHSSLIGLTTYNANYDDPMFIGYTYDVDGTQVDSTIKGVLESWYEEHFFNTKYEENIADRIFCNDREISIIDGSSLYYGSYTRLRTNKNPILICKLLEDQYIKRKDSGNGLLKYPIGLITADEVSMAGGVYDIPNPSYYLYNGRKTWTLSSRYFNGSRARVWIALADGALDSDFVDSANDARPVINLKADVLFEGSGTMSDPYKLALEN